LIETRNLGFRPSTCILQTKQRLEDKKRT